MEIKRPVKEKSHRDQHLTEKRLHQRYYIDGKRVPGVSAILKNLGWSTDFLLGWQKNLLLDGQDPDAVLEEAALLGTTTHQHLEDWIQRRETDTSHLKPLHQKFAQQATYHFACWAQQAQFHIQSTEQEVISRRHKYGGTFDLLAEHQGLRVLGDYKTSKRVYPSHIIQLAAYGIAWDEMYPDQTIQKMCVIKLGSEADLEVKWITNEERTAAGQVFLHLRALHELRKSLEKS